MSKRLVRRWWRFSVFLVTAVCGPLPASSAADDGKLALTHVTVIDATGAPPQFGQTVFISHGRIVSVSPATPPNDAKIVDCHGKFVIPGLCDMHVHVAGISADPKWSKLTLLPLLIANGVTTIRDMGGDLSALQGWRKEIADGKLIGPRIYAAGPMLDGGKSDPPSLLGIAQPNDGRAAVRDLKNRGADFIKVLSRLDRDSYFAIADETKKQGLTFVGHVPNVISAREASAAGQKSIEHIFYSNLTFDCSGREDELRHQMAEARIKRDDMAARAARDEANATFSEEKASALWQVLVQNKTWVVPTLVAMRTLARQRDEAKAQPDGLAYLPPSLRKSWSPNEIEKEISPATASWYLAQFENDLEIARSMHSAGVAMLAGSDSLDTLEFPGPSLHQELELLVKVGFTPLEALQAATAKPAEFFGANGEGGWGTIRAGKSADLVLLDADPLADIANTKSISGVIVRGKFFDRSAIDRMLADARAAADKN